MVLKRIFKCLTAVVLKRTDWRLGRCSTAAAVFRCWLTLEEAEAAPGQVSDDVLVVTSLVVGVEATDADMSTG